MTTVPGIDHPEAETEAEVTLPGRGISVSSRVELVHEGVIAVRPSVGDFVGEFVVEVGDVVEVFWRGKDTQRALPATVTAVEQGAVVRWRMRITGRVENRQRRQAVRGRVAVPVAVEHGAVGVTGTVVNLSEAGLRAEFEGLGAPPEVGTTLVLVLHLEDDEIRAAAEVVRARARGSRWTVSIRFLDIREKDQDRVRRRVFQALREERASAAD